MSDEKKQHLSTLYYRNPYLLVMTIVILLVGGASAVLLLPRMEDPRIALRNVSILTFLPGASAERIEALVNEKIEEELEEISEIKKIESTARSNVSFIKLELQDGITKYTNEEVYAKIRTRLKNVESRLPPGASSPFLDDKRGAVAYTMAVALQWNGEGDPPMNLLNRLALELKDQLLLISHTELVRIFGGVDEEMTVIIKPDDLAALGLSAEDVARFIESGDSKVSAGQLRGGRHDLKIEVAGALNNLDRIAQIPITVSQEGTLLKLGDIAKLERNYRTPVDEIGLYNQERAIFIAARVDEDVRVDVWTESARKVVDQFISTLDPRFNINIIFEQSSYTIDRLGDLVKNLVAGAVLVIFIVFLTMGWKSGLVVGLALPLSIFGALFSLTFFDEAIQQMSIFGMIIAIGLLIDSAIVVTDEVRKEVHQGVEREKAVENSVRFLFVPLLTSTFTTILGFMPIFLLPGNVGDFIRSIAISVVMALIISFFISMTIVPSLAAKVTALHAPGEKYKWWNSGLPYPKIFDEYRNFLKSSMKHPAFYLLLSIFPSILGFALIPTMPIEFFPGSDRDMFEIKLWTSTDSSIEHTLSLVKKADNLLAEVEGVKQVHWLVGGSIPSVYYNQYRNEDRNNSYAQAIVVAESSSRAAELLREIQTLLNRAIPEGQIVVKSFAQGPPADAPVAFRILGPQLSQLSSLGEEIRAIMHRYPEIIQTRATIEGGQPKLWLQADEAGARQAGLRLRDISRQFEGNLEGFSSGSVLEDVEELPVRVRLSNKERKSLKHIRGFQLVTTDFSDWVPAEALGSVALKPEIESITRFNRIRANNILGFTAPETKAVSTARNILRRIKKEVEFPPGYTIEVTGENELQNEAIENLLLYAPILIVLAITTLVLAFQSVSLATIIGLVGILSVGLGMLALKISGYPLGFNPIIGSIGLVGVAINDTIVILSAILANPLAKRGDSNAIIKESLGCGRHVLSTTLTTIGGFIPLLLFSGGTFWPPLSVVIAGGLGFSLILALFFTPLAYKLFTNLYYGEA